MKGEHPFFIQADWNNEAIDDIYVGSFSFDSSDSGVWEEINMGITMDINSDE